MGEHGWDQKQELGERAGAERGLRARSGRQPACFWPGWLSIPLRMGGPGFHHLSRPRWAWLGLKRVLGRGKSRRLQLWNCHYLRGSWTAPASPPLPSLSSHKHTLIYVLSFLPRPWRAQEKSCPSSPGSQPSDPSPWARNLYPTLPDRPKTGCQGFLPDLAEDCRDARLHSGALSSTL